ncbi:amino acid ABC transporter permease [Oxalobacter aliiformigenes]|uniref:amino acid ABC transporter permease n=1 Tax=Oxalobacter aliiformigenes TaxID=2946593 RepID=UPI0022AFE33A|nr:amino acid ABC transporter permease [Oxalobacter aliiformigenes]MCZ4065759.1 amino acid ABC transporter permease [Oxalobacter aliiformigenes]WAV99866.1 amino acid ABC transporter permease [Oxalobacter aliiformigenes]
MDFDFNFMGEALISILPAVPMTILITGTTIVISLFFAVLLIYIRYYQIPLLRQLTAFYVSFFRGTPVMMHLLLVFYGLPYMIDYLAQSFGLSFQASSIPLCVLAIIAFSFSSTATFSEILRAGILAISRGEIEAAYSIGMTHWQTMWRIILPQAFVLSIPSLGSFCITIMQRSSLAFWIAVIEITGKANLIAADSYQFMEAFIAAGFIYWTMTFVIEQIVRFIEKKHLSTLRRGVV